MIKKKGIFRKVNVLFVFLLAVGFVFPSLASARYRDVSAEGNGSIAVKLFSFFPNGNSNGLQDFSTGLGVGVDGRINFGDFFALAGELDYIGVSSASQTYDVYDAYGNYLGSSTETAYFNNLVLKVDALVTLPAGMITPFAGIGLVDNNPTLTYTGSDNGYGASASTSGSGIGLEILAGADFMVAGDGAVTAEISLPVNQTANFGDLGSNVDVGGIEIMVGYRFIL
jgi:Outer membrane protein beta-barrel domain